MSTIPTCSTDEILTVVAGQLTCAPVSCTNTYGSLKPQFNTTTRLCEAAAPTRSPTPSVTLGALPSASMTARPLNVSASASPSRGTLSLSCVHGSVISCGVGGCACACDAGWTTRLPGDGRPLLVQCNDTALLRESGGQASAVSCDSAFTCLFVDRLPYALSMLGIASGCFLVLFCVLWRCLCPMWRPRCPRCCCCRHRRPARRVEERERAEGPRPKGGLCGRCNTEGGEQSFTSTVRRHARWPSAEQGESPRSGASAGGLGAATPALPLQSGSSEGTAEVVHVTSPLRPLRAAHFMLREVVSATLAPSPAMAAIASRMTRNRETVRGEAKHV